MKITYGKRHPSGLRFVFGDGKKIGEIRPTFNSTIYTCEHCGSRAEKNVRISGHTLYLDGRLWLNDELVPVGKGGSSGFWAHRLRDVQAKCKQVMGVN